MPHSLNIETAKRILIAKEYFDNVKEKMGPSFIDAHVFGSVAKNLATEKSDIDVIFVFKKMCPTAKWYHNSIAGGKFKNGRNGTVSKAWNGHFMFDCAHELMKKYGVEISPYPHYEQDGPDKPIWLCGTTYVPFREIIKDSIRYSDLPKATF